MLTDAKNQTQYSRYFLLVLWIILPSLPFWGDFASTWLILIIVWEFLGIIAIIQTLVIYSDIKQNENLKKQVGGLLLGWLAQSVMIIIFLVAWGSFSVWSESDIGFAIRNLLLLLVSIIIPQFLAVFSYLILA